MSEFYMSITANFSSIDNAKQVESDLNNLAREYSDDFTKTICNLNSVSLCGEDKEIYIDKIYREDERLMIHATGGMFDTPTWFVKALALLGSKKTHIVYDADEGSVEYYFLFKKRVGKEAYYGKSKSLQGKVTADTGSNLFLPSERVTVKATLVKALYSDGMYGPIHTLYMKTSDGHDIVYRGSSEKLGKVHDDEYEDLLSFSAEFEKGELDKKTVSFVKRPTNVVLEEVDLSKIEVPKFSDDNEKFFNGKFGFIVEDYFRTYEADGERFLMSLNEDGFSGHSYRDIITNVIRSKEGRFRAFDLEIYLEKGKRRLTTIESKFKCKKKSISDLADHFISLGVDYEEKIYDPYISLKWSVDSLNINLHVTKSGFKLQLKSNPKYSQ